jgi:MraZ protein
MPPSVGFLGKHYLRIDDKGRVTMPARFKAVLRDQYPQDQDQVVVRLSWDGNLRVEPYSEYAKVADQYEQGNDRDPRARRRKNVINALAESEKIDAGGRIRLSPDLRSLAKLDREVTLLGDNRAFEIWDRVRWQAAQEAALRDMEEQNALAEMPVRQEEP